MALEKIKLKNSGSSFIGLGGIIIISMVLFFGAYFWVQENVDNSGVELDEKYTDSYDNLKDSQDNLDTEVKSMKGSFSAMSEADNTFQVAWNGLKGLGKALILPIKFVDVSLNTWEAVVPGMGLLPEWVSSLIFIGIIAFVVFLVLSILKGEPRLSN